MTMATKKRTKAPKSLSHGRPKLLRPPPSLTASKATRTLIRKHHTLSKQLAKSLKDGDQTTAAKLAEEIEAQGGIESYQRASLIGQGKQRGGDSSKLLMEWLSPVHHDTSEGKGKTFRMLEVGSLSKNNACSRSGLFEMERIDLNSQEEGIQQQDFMERPLPKLDDERFDIISLSLVLNYVPDAVGKGEMLRRTAKFLRHQSVEGAAKEYFPSLFLVLPAPCVENSRYMDEEKLENIMNSLGYIKVKRKLTTKLVYYLYLWRKEEKAEIGKIVFKKVEIRSGKTRNNFSITLK